MTLGEDQGGEARFESGDSMSAYLRDRVMEDMQVLSLLEIKRDIEGFLYLYQIVFRGLSRNKVII